MMLLKLDNRNDLVKNGVGIRNLIKGECYAKKM
jgi:hypothetical protein